MEPFFIINASLPRLQITFDVGTDSFAHASGLMFSDGNGGDVSLICLSRGGSEIVCGTADITNNDNVYYIKLPLYSSGFIVSRLPIYVQTVL